MFIGPFRTPAENLIVIGVFGEDSSIGLVQVFFGEFTGQVSRLPGWSEVRPTSDAGAFERDLEAGVENLFGGASA